MREWEWEKAGGGSGLDEASAVVVVGEMEF
jgi:hypothetical protein